MSNSIPENRKPLTRTVIAKIENENLKARIKKLEEEKLELIKENETAEMHTINAQYDIQALKSKYEQAEEMLSNLKVEEMILVTKVEETQDNLTRANKKLDEIKNVGLSDEMKELKLEKTKLRDLERELARKEKLIELLTRYSDADKVKELENKIANKKREFELMAAHVNGLLFLKLGDPTKL